MDREDRWDIYIAERLKKEQDNLHQVNPLVEDFVSMLEPPGDKILLDLGCGLGRHMHYTACQGFKTIGCDISSRTLESAEDLARGRGLNLEFVQCDFLDLPFNNSVFSGVMAIDSIHHDFLENILGSLREVHRVMKTGALICLNPLSVRDQLLDLGRRMGDRLSLVHRVPHYFFTADEIRFLLERTYFRIVHMDVCSYTQNREGREVFREKFQIIARREEKPRGNFRYMPRPLL